MRGVCITDNYRFMELAAPLFTTSLLTFWAIFLAEMGDKSQLVCMTLAAKHRSRPILIAAVLAFGLLNLIAVVLGNALSLWISEFWMTLIAACAFAYFGISNLRGEDEDDDDDDAVKSKGNLVLSTFLLLLVAEMGDKTQLAVVTLSTTHSPLAVWLGATLALVTTSALGIYAGRRWLSKLDMSLLHKISGAFFLVLAASLCVQLYQLTA